MEYVIPFTQESPVCPAGNQIPESKTPTATPMRAD
jgi:hypothetical protein